ncbi:hypothetical protein ACTG4Q_20795 [Bradyrhizobium denitrificans]
MQDLTIDETRRLILLRAEMMRLLEHRPDRPRRIITWLKWRRRAELRRQRLRIDPPRG